MLKQLRLAGLLSWLQSHVPDNHHIRAGYARLQAAADWEKEGAGDAASDRLLAGAFAGLAWLSPRLHVLLPSFLQKGRGPAKTPHPSAWLGR